jgi:hypothetical protein
LVYALVYGLELRLNGVVEFRVTDDDDDDDFLFISRGRRVPYRHLCQGRPGAVSNIVT